MDRSSGEQRQIGTEESTTIREHSPTKPGTDLRSPVSLHSLAVNIAVKSISKAYSLFPLVPGPHKGLQTTVATSYSISSSDRDRCGGY